MKARRFVKGLEASSAAKRKFREPDDSGHKGPITVADYAKRWVEDRKKIGLATATDDLARLRLHVLPTLGAMALEDVRPRQIRDLVLELRKRATLAPRSVRHVYATAACMFRTAVADELIPYTPCVLARGILPKNVDKDASHPVLDGEPRSLATGLATAQRNWRNRWRKTATPAGHYSI